MTLRCQLDLMAFGFFIVVFFAILLKKGLAYGKEF